MSLHIYMCVYRPPIMPVHTAAGQDRFFGSFGFRTHGVTLKIVSWWFISAQTFGG